MVLIFFFVALSFLLSFCSCGDPIYLGHDCPDTIPLFGSNSTYQSNLNTLLSSLSSNATSNSNNAYSNATIGQSTDAVYGLYYCTGYVTRDVCSNCVNFGARDILQHCPNRKTSYIWYDECMLRYSDQSFFSTVSDSPSFNLYNPNNISDPIRFNELLGDTMNDTATEAASNLERFSIKEANFTNNQTLYCMAQCSPDLSGNECNICLVGAIADQLSSFSGLQGGRVLNPSCNIRFEMYCFFPVKALRPTLHAPPPPSDRTTSPENEGKSWRKIVAIVVPVAVAGLILFSVLWYCFLIRKRKQDLSKEKGGNRIKNAESLQFDFSEVLSATNNFADVNKIGEGGFGEVFKGKLPNGQEIAVKRLSRDSRQGAKEFKNEVVLVAKLQHRNLVRLLGFCLEGEEKILIYDGYMPPEYVIHGQFSVKSDVFSYGLLVLEIVSGKKNSSFYQTDSVQTLMSHAWSYWNAGTAFELVDPIMRENCSQSEIMRCIHIGLLCVQENVAARPTMASVVLMLNSYSVTLPLPSQPAFFVQSRMESDQSNSRTIPLSVNGLSISVLESR
ncbi:cysteine-rich receptor-like protein kinase 10 isoform X2 [Telopea speciosissima]|uniref:cysteine-rich receptor-like protein kinase 10 isoform X2 n=1 Tax=Telopea speciosissima TaxID=54955 RepID=UPI001CC77B54|nr:cysteine-rich receptor-like protein kinase 10 isoform X2 [Telopea speciosissima]